MVNYNNGKIYKLECLTTGLIYVGSTTKQYLSQRMVQHKSEYMSYKDGKRGYITSFKIIEGDNYDIQLLESVNCNTKDELLAREGHYIKTLECVNKYISGRTKQQYRNDNKDFYDDYHQEYSKDWYQANKEKLKQLVKCDCGGKYQLYGKSHHFKSIKHQTFLNNQI